MNDALCTVVTVGVTTERVGGIGGGGGDDEAVARTGGGCYGMQWQSCTATPPIELRHALQAASRQRTSRSVAGEGHGTLPPDMLTGCPCLLSTVDRRGKGR